MATVLNWASRVLFNEDKVGVSHAWRRRGLELLSCGLCLYLRENVSSCTEGTYSGWPYTEGRGGGGHTHQLTVLTAHRCTQFHYAHHKGYYRVQGVIASMTAESGDTSTIAIIIIVNTCTG